MPGPLSHEEFCEWMAFYRIQPFGEEWRQTARLCNVIANFHRSAKCRPFEEDEWMPVRRTTVAQPADEMLMRWKVIADLQNARVAADSAT